MHLLDTPGVLPPKIESVETGMKLALCGEQLFFNHHNNHCYSGNVVVLGSWSHLLVYYVFLLYSTNIYIFFSFLLKGQF